jgi:DNA invertase Pin-like site-specific DNA recombinase
MLNHRNNNNNNSFSPKIDESKKVVIYARISREKNHGGSDVSLDNQIATGRHWASLNGYSVAGEYIEVKSAKRASNRPEFQKALKKVKAEKCVLFLHSLSRGFRSTVNAIQVASDLDKAGCNLVSHNDNIDTTTPMGRFFYTLLNAVNQLDREQISHRTKEALDHKKAKNEKLGGAVPYGFKVARNGSNLAVVASEQKNLKMMLKAREAGVTYVKIAHTLNSKKIPSKTGRKWSPKVVRGIILRANEHEKLAMAA